MHLTVSCPDPELLSPCPKDNATDAPQRDQTHVCHDWGYISILDDPSVDEFRKSVTVKILVDGNAYEYRAGNRLVGINCVGGGDGRESRDLEASTRPANDYDRLEV